MEIVQNPNVKFKKTLSKRPYTRRIVIHHSASHKTTTAEDIQSWHYNRGWAGIGYHYVIDYAGVITQGRPEDTQGAHAYQDKQHEANTDGIGICVIGNFMDRKPTEAQITSLVWLIKNIQSRYGEIPVIGHRDVMPTSCPGDSFPLTEVKEKVNSKKEHDFVKLSLHGYVEDVPAINREGNYYIPVRWLERIGYNVCWDEKKQTVSVSYKQ